MKVRQHEKWGKWWKWKGKTGTGRLGVGAGRRWAILWGEMRGRMDELDDTIILCLLYSAPKWAMRLSLATPRSRDSTNSNRLEEAATPLGLSLTTATGYLLSVWACERPRQKKR